jgi:cell division protein FtsB
VKKVTALLILLIGLLQYKLWFGDGNVLEFQRLNDRIAELQQEGAKRRERNAALEAEVMDLKQGLDAVEERARHELGMVMEGEQFVQVIDPQHEAEPSVSPSSEKPSATDDLSDAAKRSNYEKPRPKKPKAAELSPQPAKKPADTINSAKQPDQQAISKKQPPKPKPAPKPINGEKPSAATALKKPSEADR